MKSLCFIPYKCVGGSGTFNQKEVFHRLLKASWPVFERSIMEIAVFTPHRPADEFNDLPEASRRRGNPFWGFVGNMLGLQPERYPVENEGVSREIAGIRQYEQRRAEANAPPGPPSVTLGELAQEAVEHVKQAVRKVPALKRATEFLARVLDAGPVAEKRVMELAKLEGISEKTVKRARAKLKVKASKKGRGGWFLSMTRAESNGKEGRDS